MPFNVLLSVTYTFLYVLRRANDLLYYGKTKMDLPGMASTTSHVQIKLKGLQRPPCMSLCDLSDILSQPSISFQERKEPIKLNMSLSGIGKRPDLPIVKRSGNIPSPLIVFLFFVSPHSCMPTNQRHLDYLLDTRGYFLLHVLHAKGT